MCSVTRSWEISGSPYPFFAAAFFPGFAFTNVIFASLLVVDNSLNRSSVSSSSSPYRHFPLQLLVIIIFNAYCFHATAPPFLLSEYKKTTNRIRPVVPTLQNSVNGFLILIAFLISLTYSSVLIGLHIQAPYARNGYHTEQLIVLFIQFFQFLCCLSHTHINFINLSILPLTSSYEFGNNDLNISKTSGFPPYKARPNCAKTFCFYSSSLFSNILYRANIQDLFPR